MNTRDIRSLENGQWIFWAVAVPLTVLVISLSLWYADNIGPRRSKSLASRQSDLPQPTIAPQRSVYYDYPGLETQVDRY